FGSFLTVSTYRFLRPVSVVHPGSARPQCKTRIRFYDNVPVLSWLVLGGRCRNCKARISARYLIVEIFTGAMFVACYAHFGLTLATMYYWVFCFLLSGMFYFFS